MTGLVYIGKVISVDSIPNADKIESLEVVCGTGGRWRGTAMKGQFHPGDSCQVYLQDCIVPQAPELSFMEKHNWRVRMQRFRGVPSEVLVMSQSLPGDIGIDVTQAAGVTRYIKPIPDNIAGDVLGDFPSFIPKTDEPNFQSVPEMVQFLRGKPFVATVKCDGSSATIYRHGDHFGCCSRNLEMKDTPNNAIWQIARKYSLQERLPDGIAIQLEVVGPGIQKNPMGLKVVEPRAFNVYDFRSCTYFNPSQLCLDLGIPSVPVTAEGDSFGFASDDDLRKLAEGIYDNGRPREGVVIRPKSEMRMPTGERVSFKVINLLYRD